MHSNSLNISLNWFTGKEDLADAYFIRRKVFIEEQQISEADEFDNSDQNALHLVLYINQLPIATGRILPKQNYAIFGRIAVLPQYRQQHLGQKIVTHLIHKANEIGLYQHRLHAQTHAQAFYAKLGFYPFGSIFLEANIPHIEMQHKGDYLIDSNMTHHHNK